MVKNPAKYKPYPAYRPSGIEWLGEIPAHWEVKRLKYLATVNDEALPETTDPDTEITYVDIGNVDSVRGITGTEDLVFEDAPSRARRIVRQGDIIISTVRTYLKAIARIESTDANLIASTGFAVIRPSDLDDGFGAYALSAPYFVESVVAHSVGVSYPAINASELVCLDLAYPPFSEQRSIARFLDQETARISELVAKKDRLIALLQEKRTAHITRAVTRGLDPSVQMKDSGVEWLGDVPAHWEVKRVKHVCSVRRGASPRPITNPDYFDPNGEYGWVRIADVTASNHYLEKTSDYVSELGRSLSVPLEPGELIVSIAGSVGKPIITNMKCCIHDGFVNLLGPTEYTEFLYYIFLSEQPYAGLGKLGTQLNLNTDTIGDIRIPLPSFTEQRAIAEFLDRETARLDGLIAKVAEAIDRLRELRTALISAAVTGRIDVREEAE